MSVTDILNRARILGVSLSPNGEFVKMRGPKSALATLRPEIAANKLAVIAHLRSLYGVAPFWPWAPHVSAADVGRLRSELATLIARLADLEHWPDALCAEVLDRAARDPLSALMPNLSYFRERLDDVQAEAHAREEAARRAWRFDSEI